MKQDDDISGLLATVLAARSFEPAATALLRPLLDIANQALASSPFAGQGKITRGLLHLRPGDEYRQILVLERSARGDTGSLIWTPANRDAPLAAPTAWRWVNEHHGPVSVDVRRGTVLPHVSGAALVWDRDALPRAFNTDRSMLDFSGRNTTHVHVVPIRTAGAPPHGFVALEAECAAASGSSFVWPACQERLRLLVDAVAPHLLGLPAETAAPTSATDEFLPVIGPTMAPIVEMLRVFAQQDETVLVGGPTGAGKTRLARWCHAQSARAKAPFESLDLNTVPEELQLGELFGWKKGAFTGAARDSEGALHRAERGTLFIDEIDKLSLKAQAGLLHVLEERRYRALGAGGGETRADVRFIIGTNADLRASVADGRFREDLYFRMNVLPVKLPPLDRRRDEIVPWARYMLDRRGRGGAVVRPARFSPEAEAVLLAEPWPGNLRQLDNIVRRAYTIGLIDVATRPGEIVLDKEHVQRALAYESGERSASLTTLLNAAAAAFVAEAERRLSQGATPLDLDLADAFRGFVLAAAAARAGSKEESLKLLGRESLLAGRNHHKLYRREIDRVRALCEAVGLPLPPSLQDLTEER